MEGYAKLSSLMATDTEFAIYRKFGALDAQNLLYYQAELMRLEEDLRETAVEDRRSQDSEKRLFSDNWFELSNAEPGKNLQFQKVMQIRRTLKEYSPQVLTVALTKSGLWSRRLSHTTGHYSQIGPALCLQSQDVATMAYTSRSWQFLPPRSGRAYLG